MSKTSKLYIIIIIYGRKFSLTFTDCTFFTIIKLGFYGCIIVKTVRIMVFMAVAVLILQI